MTDTRHALVIGGGLIGCFSAYRLHQLGWRVTLLERDRLGAGASHGNCGYICPSHALPLSGPGVIRKSLPALWRRDGALSIPPRFDPTLWRWFLTFRSHCRQDRVKLAAEARRRLLQSSMELYRQFISETEFDCQWREEGLLLVFQREAEFAEYASTAERLERDFGLRVTSHPGEQVRELEPALRSGLAGGWWFPDDTHLRPDRLLTALREGLAARGVEIREGVEATGWRVVNGRAESVEIADGEPLPTDLIVLAAGAESARFAPRLGCRLPIVPGKGYSITTRVPSAPPRVPMIFESHHVAVTPFADSFRIGSTMEFVGYDRSINPRRLQLLRDSAAEHLAAPLDGEELETWAGWRPMCADGVPCIGPSPATPNVIVASGNGMIGLATAPATGRLAAELASGETPHIDPAPYSLHRWK